MNTQQIVSDLILAAKNLSLREGFRVEPKNYFRASGSWKCERNLFFERIDPRDQTDLIEHEGMATIPGTAAHEFFQSRLSKIDSKFEHEVEIKIEHKNIVLTGHADSIIGLNDDGSHGHFLESDCVLLIDYKSMKNLYYADDNDASKHHFIQINLYAHAISKMVGHSNIYCHVVPIHKENYEHKVQAFKYDELAAIQILDKLEGIYQSVENDVAPDADPEESWECRFCNYQDECKHLGGKKWGTEVKF